MKRGGDNLIESTIAELAFIFVFTLSFVFVYNTVSTAAEPTDAASDRTLPTGSVGAPGDPEAVATAFRDVVLSAREACGCDIDFQASDTGAAFSIVTLCRRPSGARILFETGQSKLSAVGKACFDALCPAILPEARRHRSSITRIAIEGHASPEGFSDATRRSLGCFDDKDCNFLLSTRRSRNVYRHCKTRISSPEGRRILAAASGDPLGVEAWVRFYDGVVGLSGAGDLAPVRRSGAQGGDIDDDASRRVEFRFSLRAAENGR